MFALVEQIDQREADGRAQEAVDGMQHRVPMRHADIEAVQLAQYFSREDEQQDNHFQRGGQFDVQLAGKEARQNHQHQRQAAHEHALKITAQRRTDEHENHQRAEHEIHRQRRLILIGGIFFSCLMFFFIHCASRFFHIIAQFMPRTYLFFRFSQPQTSARRLQPGFSCIFISYFLQIFGRFGFPTDRREFLEIRKFFLIFSEKTVYKSLFPCYNILDFRAWRTRPSRHNPSWF